MYAKLTSQELLDNLDNQCGDYADGERVVSIVQDIFDGSDVEKVKWYCSDIHGIQHLMRRHSSGSGGFLAKRTCLKLCWRRN